MTKKKNHYRMKAETGYMGMALPDSRRPVSIEVTKDENGIITRVEIKEDNQDES